MARYPQDEYSQKGDTTPTPSENKEDIAQKEVLDHDIIGNSNVTGEEAMHHGHLTDEELEVQKKLLRKIGKTPLGVVLSKSSADCIQRFLDHAVGDAGVSHELHRSQQYVQKVYPILNNC